MAVVYSACLQYIIRIIVEPIKTTYWNLFRYFIQRIKPCVNKIIFIRYKNWNWYRHNIILCNPMYKFYAFFSIRSEITQSFIYFENNVHTIKDRINCDFSDAPFNRCNLNDDDKSHFSNATYFQLRNHLLRIKHWCAIFSNASLSKRTIQSTKRASNRKYINTKQNSTIIHFGN